MNNQEILLKIKKPETHLFSLLKIDDIVFPHPYCITTKHVEVASDSFCGILGIEAIEEAERLGACCDTCKQLSRKDYGRKILPYKEHISEKTLFIEVPQNTNLNDIEGLHSYLMSIKDDAEALGISGFAFPLKRELQDAKIS